jgi:hypothetical protein
MSESIQTTNLQQSNFYGEMQLLSIFSTEFKLHSPSYANFLFGPNIQIPNAARDIEKVADPTNVNPVCESGTWGHNIYS